MYSDMKGYIDTRDYDAKLNLNLLTFVENDISQFPGRLYRH
jgi:hypothetical protein